MMHEYRESPYSEGICAGCGLPFSRCQGLKLQRLPSFLAAIDATMEAMGEWDQWCRRYGIDPNTPDETVFDDYLHGRTPKRPQQEYWYHAGSEPIPFNPFPTVPRPLYRAQANTQVRRVEVNELERWFRL